MKRAINVVSVCLLLVLLMSCWSSSNTKEKLYEKYSSVEVGMTEDNMLKVLGKPYRKESHITGDYWEWKDSNNNLRIRIKFVPKLRIVMTKAWIE
jgi:hypothetical protein